MEREKKQVHRLAKLGVGNFEDVAATERLQNDMLRRLERTLEGEGSHKPRANDQRRAQTRCPRLATPAPNRNNSGPAQEGSPGRILRVAVGPQRK
jgi:hypothetical protein